MHTGYAATDRAFPSFFFIVQKWLDPIHLNMLQILNHTHPIFRSVARIKHGQAFTGKIGAFKTILN
jgi:hypothetical protein